MTSSSAQTPSSDQDQRVTATAPPAPSLLSSIFTVTDAAKHQIELLRDRTIRHSRFYAVFTELAHQSQFAPADHLIFVIGPTGAGKTTLARALATQLHSHFRAVGTVAGEIPVINMQLKLEQSKEFVWRRFYIAALRELGEPLIDKKTDLVAALATLRNSGLRVGPFAASDQDIGDLRDCLEHQLTARKTRYVLIDEANLLAMTKASRSDKKSQMEVLKSLAASVRATRFVFFATSDALPLLHLSPQLSRRVHVIRFDPYSADTADLNALGSALLTYLESLPKGYDFRLEDRIRTIQETTSGLFGVTAEWVQRAVADAVVANRPLAWGDMEKSAPDAQTVESLRRDVRHFRAFFSDVQMQEPAPAVVSDRPARSAKPGIRKPKRDIRVPLNGV